MNAARPPEASARSVKLTSDGALGVMLSASTTVVICSAGADLAKNKKAAKNANGAATSAISRIVPVLTAMRFRQDPPKNQLAPLSIALTPFGNRLPPFGGPRLCVPASRRVCLFQVTQGLSARKGKPFSDAIDTVHAPASGRRPRRDPKREDGGRDHTKKY